MAADIQSEMNKQILRQICLEKRKQLENKKALSEIICNRLLPYLIDKTILSYNPFNDEVDVSFINNNNDVAYPVVCDNHLLKAYKSSDSFIRNTYGIYEPDISKSVFFDKKDIDVIIVPLLGFDLNRNRLGYGGGHYDRYLSDYEGLKIGVAFDIQQLDYIETNKNDVPLDIIITETRTI